MDHVGLTLDSTDQSVTFYRNHKFVMTEKNMPRKTFRLACCTNVKDDVVTIVDSRPGKYTWTHQDVKTIETK